MMSPGLALFTAAWIVLETTRTAASAEAISTARSGERCGEGEFAHGSSSPFWNRVLDSNSFRTGGIGCARMRPRSLVVNTRCRSEIAGGGERKWNNSE